MRIAFPTDDGTTIQRHFGRATHYAVVTIEDGAAGAREVRSKEAHHHGNGHADDHHSHDHRNMFAPVADCQAMIAGHMGTPAYTAAQSNGLQVILTDEPTIDGALDAWLAGTLANRPALLHTPDHDHHAGA